jgi:ribonuclease HII
MSPTLDVERALVVGGARLVAGMDEVGRGALAGPVSVGVVVVGHQTGDAPVGVADSKLLTPAAREALVPMLRRWPVAWAVGHALPAEIDAHGMTAALRLAGSRALALATQVCGGVDAVVLDGSFDWLSPPGHGGRPTVPTRVKADQHCASVSGASVLAKVERDTIMAELSTCYPGFGWDRNRGYGTRAHVDALRACGPTIHHRRSWNLPVPDESAKMAP